MHEQTINLQSQQLQYDSCAESQCLCYRPRDMVFCVRITGILTHKAHLLPIKTSSTPQQNSLKNSRIGHLIRLNLWEISLFVVFTFQISKNAIFVHIKYQRKAKETKLYWAVSFTRTERIFGAA